MSAELKAALLVGGIILFVGGLMLLSIFWPMGVVIIAALVECVGVYFMWKAFVEMFKPQTLRRKE